MKILLLVLILIAVVIMFTKGSKQEAQRQDHVVPRYHPVYLDAQTPYLNEQIMYGEWPQEISSSL